MVRKLKKRKGERLEVENSKPKHDGRKLDPAPVWMSRPKFCNMAVLLKMENWTSMIVAEVQHKFKRPNMLAVLTF